MAALALSYVWKPLAIAAALAALIGYRAMLVSQRDAARAQAATLSERLSQCAASTDALKRAIAEQNAALARMRDEQSQAAAMQRSREAASAARAEAVFKREAAKANAIGNEDVPSDCEGAIRWGNGEGPELGQW
jgi:uncharacterized protein